MNDMKNNKKSIRDKVGSAVEKAGHKLSNAGFKKAGKVVHDLGDKIEENHKNPTHPHKV